MFLLLNIVFMQVEFLYGFWTNSLGLISDAYHMFFDCMSLCIGLYATYISHLPPNKTFPVGFGRFEVLGGFTNGVLLILVSIYVGYEGLMRLFNPPEVGTDRLITVAVLGLLVNLIGLVFFHDHAHGHDDHSCPHHHKDESLEEGGHHHVSGTNANMRGVFLHVLADTLGSVGVIVSAFLIENFGLQIADPLSSILIACMIFASVMPLLQSTVDTLLHRTPTDALAAWKPLASRVTEEHYWALNHEVIFGFMSLRTTQQLVMKAQSEAQRTFDRRGVTDGYIQLNVIDHE